MNLRHLSTLVDAQSGAARVTSLAWSPNNLKLAAVINKRTIILFDENGERRDKIAAKGADKSSKVFQVQAVAFSHDSTRLATGQTDNCVLVYRIGDNWGEKKALVHRFTQTCAVTCMIWPHQQQNFIVMGLMDGKVRVADVKRNRSQSLYATNSYTCSLIASPNGESIFSGHADGSVYRYTFDSSGGGYSSGRILRHSCPPYALSFASNCILVGGCDSKLLVYDTDGRVLQNFDYSRAEGGEREFTTAAASPSGQTVVVGSFNRIRVFGWKATAQMWEEAKVKNVDNLYTVTCLSFRGDGSRLVLGSLCGAVEMYDCCLRRVIYKNKFELTYVGISQVIVKKLSTGNRVILQSLTDSALERVQIMGHDRYIVAYTPSTLIVGDMEERKNSEIPFSPTGSEKFYFETDKVCMIFNAGELSLLEYGSNEPLCAVRTELINPHLVSVRMNERVVRGSGDMKFMAYLMDWKTISIMDLTNCLELASLSHGAKIDWLELNETGTKLLFRDKRLKLWVFDIKSKEKTGIASYCTYVQWVPQSDVVVCQSRSSLCVLYNIDRPHQVTPLQIKGDIVDLTRQSGKTQVVVAEGGATTSYDLDEGLIEFGTAMEDGNFTRAIAFLENLELSPETVVMWRQLSENALADRQLAIAKRCFAALGELDQVDFLEDVLRKAAEEADQHGGDGLQSYDVQARLAVMDGHFQLAENLYLSQGRVDEAMSMYHSIHKWDEALSLAEHERHPQLDSIREKYYENLIATGREARAAQLKEEERDYRTAAQLYLKAGLPARAADLVLSDGDLRNQGDLVERIGTALSASGLYDRAGDLWESVQQFQRALDVFRKGHCYAKAIELCRVSFPNDVINLEEEWGDHLCQSKKLEAAIPHYIEAGRNVKAVEAALQAKQWHKAVLILGTLEPEVAHRYYIDVGDAYSGLRDYAHAEKYYVEGGDPRKAIDMHVHANRWEEAYRLAVSCNLQDDIASSFIGHGQELEAQGRLKEAEKVYVTVEEADLAIAMYRRAKKYDKVVRLVKYYQPERLADTYCFIAEELQTDGQFNQAEKYFLASDEDGWKKVTDMYTNHSMWEDCYRISKEYGGPSASHKAAYDWARSLRGDSAVRLLTKFGLIEHAVNHACDQLHFEFAFELAKLTAKDRLPYIHGKYANVLEDAGKWEEAEHHFLLADQPKEAVLMYIHINDWEKATSVAEEHAPDSLLDVLLGQAHKMFDEKDFSQAEKLLIRAQRPEQAVSMYKQHNMWQDALRVGQVFFVKKELNELHAEYEAHMSGQGPRSAQELLDPARAHEKNGDHVEAVEAYMRITTEHSDDKQLLVQVWNKAVDLAVKFTPDTAKETMATVANRMAALELYEEAAEYCLKSGDYKRTVEMFVSAENWKKARRVAKKLIPELLPHVDQAQTQFYERKGDAKALVDVDAIAGLDMLATQGEWDQCIELAKEKGQGVYEKYIARYAAHLLQENNSPADALALFKSTIAPAKPQVFKCYEEMALGILNMPMTLPFRLVADLRDVLLTVLEGIPANIRLSHSDQVSRLQTMLLLSHFFALRSAALTQSPKLDGISEHITLGIIRYTNLINADQRYYEAAQMLRASADRQGVAFTFFNRLLDIFEVVDGGADELNQTDDFDFTDVPSEMVLPEKPCISEEERTEISEWVVAMSTEQSLETSLPLDERGFYEASIVNPTTETMEDVCLITAYPILGSRVEFNKTMGLAAQKEYWNLFLAHTKSSHNAECQDVIQFIKRWCGSAAATSFAVAIR